MTVVADSLIDHQNVIFLRELGTVFLLWISTFLIGLLQIYIQQTAIQDMSILIRKDIVAGLLAINLESYKKHDGSVYESWLQNDVNLIEQHAFNNFFYTIRFFANAIFSLIALWFYHYILFIVAFFGGERQKVSLARLLVEPAGLVILDEGFSSIDLTTTQNLLTTLFNSEIQTVILVSHRPIEVENFNFIHIDLGKRVTENGR